MRIITLFYILANPFMPDITKDNWILISVLAFHLLQYHVM